MRKKRILVPQLADLPTNKVVQDLAEAVHTLQDDLPRYALCSVTFATPDADTEVRHELGYVPTTYMVLSKTAACDVYDGTRTPSSRILVLRGTAAATVVLKVY